METEVIWYVKPFIWLNKQVEWFKKFFSKDDGANDMRKLIEFLITCVFLFTFAKEALMFGTDDDIPDMPTNWLWLFAAMLGFKASQEIVKNFGKGDSNVK